MSINRMVDMGLLDSIILQYQNPQNPTHCIQDNLVYDQVIDISETVYFNSSVLSNVMRRKH